jgi:hypothetical protein
MVDTTNFRARYAKPGSSSYIEYELGFNGRHHYLLREGEDYAGLWFDDNKVLQDYDGIFELPDRARATIIAAGFSLGDIG